MDVQSIDIAIQRLDCVLEVLKSPTGLTIGGVGNYMTAIGIFNDVNAVREFLMETKGDFKLNDKMEVD